MKKMHGIMEYQLKLKKDQQSVKRHKALGLTGLSTEMIQTTEGIGTQWLLDLCNGIVKEGCIPEY